MAEIQLGSLSANLELDLRLFESATKTALETLRKLDDQFKSLAAAAISSLTSIGSAAQKAVFSIEALGRAMAMMGKIPITIPPGLLPPTMLPQGPPPLILPNAVTPPPPAAVVTQTPAPPPLILPNAVMPFPAPPPPPAPPPAPLPPVIPNFASTLRATTLALQPMLALRQAAMGLNLTMSGLAQTFLQWGQQVSAAVSKAMGSILNLRTVMIGFAAMMVLRPVLGDIATFDQKVAEMRSVVAENVGFSEEAFQNLRTEALRLGATTIFSAPQAAEAMAELSRAGFGAEQVLQMINPTLKMAAIEHMNLSEAVKIVSSTLHQFQLPASEATHITDMLAKGSVLSATSVRGLGSALSFVGSTSSVFDISAQETIAVLSGLSQSGIDATRGGTGLRAVYQGLVQETPKHTRVLAEMGLTYDQINPKTVGLIQALKVLKEHHLDATRAMILFRQNGMTAALSMLQNLDAIQKFNVELGNAAGTVDRMAATSTNNLKDAMTQLWNVVSVGYVKLGEGGLLGSLRGLVDGFANALRAMMGFMEPLGPGATKAYALAAAIQAIAVALAAAVAIQLGGALLTFFGTGVGLAVLAVAGIAAAYTLLTAEDTRYADQQAKVNALVEKMGKLSNESSQIAIDGLKKQTQATIDLMNVELERLKMAQPTALDTMRNMSREGMSWFEQAKKALFFGDTTAGGEVTTVQQERMAAMAADIAKAQAALDRAKGLTGTPEIAPSKYQPGVEPYHEAAKAAKDKSDRLAAEALRGRMEAIKGEIQQAKQLADVEKARNDLLIEQTRLTYDRVGLAEAEGLAKIDAVKQDQLTNALAIDRWKALQASGTLVKKSDIERVASDIQELTIRAQTLSVEEQIARLRMQQALSAAEYDNVARGMANAKTTSEEEYRLSLGLSAMAQDEEQKAMLFAGESRQAMQKQEIQNAIALNAIKQERADEAIRTAEAALENARRVGTPEQVVTAGQEGQVALNNMLLAKREGENLLKDLSRVPTTLGKVAADAVNDIIQAFTTGAGNFGSVFAKIGQSFMQPFLTKGMAGMQDIMTGIFGSMSESTQRLVGAGIGVAFTAISTLFNQADTKIESLGDSAKQNIEQVERTRGLIAGDQSIAVQQLSENLSMAFRPTNEILLRMEMVLRAIFGSDAGLPPGAIMPTNQLYAPELMASVRLG